MTKNLVANFISFFKDLLIYKPPSPMDRFILKEHEPKRPGLLSNLSPLVDELNTLLRFARRLQTAIERAKDTLSQGLDQEKIAALAQEVEVLEAQKAALSPILLAYNSGEDFKQWNISASLAENIIMINKLFRLPDNNDVVIREISIPTSPARKAMLVFMKGLVDNKDITSSVLMPLFAVKELSGNILEALITNHLSSNQAIQINDYQTMIQGISGGNSALFVDGVDGAVLIYTKGFERRAVGRPMIEQTIRGSQSAFTETLRTNISLVRLAIRSPDLVTEMITLGARSQINCAVMYLASIANPDLVREVKRRLNAITTDYIAAGSLDEFIEDDPYIPLPETLSTERPDRVSSHLAEGRVAILLDGDPFALVVPVSLFTLFHSPEDFALKQPSGTFMRIFRLAASFFAGIFPAFYIAICYYHPEVLPTDLLLAIAGARERIPFPSIVEVLFMEFSLEFIREASTRKPGLLGETLGIVGGIILGQAVVTANLISPITVVVVAITAIASFAIPDYRMGMAVRQVRFLYLIAAVLLGLVGVASVLFILTVILSSMKSFGVPYFSPLAPKVIPGLDVVLRGPVFRQEKRPDELNTLDKRRQPAISRKWAGKLKFLKQKKSK